MWELDTTCLTTAEADTPSGEATPSYGSLRRRLRLPPSKEGRAAVDALPPAVEALLFLPALSPPLAPLLAAASDGCLCCWGALITPAFPLGSLWVPLGSQAGTVP